MTAKPSKSGGSREKAKGSRWQKLTESQARRLDGLRSGPLENRKDFYEALCARGRSSPEAAKRGWERLLAGEVAFTADWQRTIAQTLDMELARLLELLGFKEEDTESNQTPTSYMQARQAVYRIWIDMTTRKVAMPIDWEHDLVEAVHRSWFQFFCDTRETLKNIEPWEKGDPANAMRLAVRLRGILNGALRQHLTRWHEPFTRWLKVEKSKEENRPVSASTLQCRFPDFELLRRDMDQATTELAGQAMELEKELAALT